MRNPLAIVRRQVERQAFCRGCDEIIEKGSEMISTFSYRNRGQNIHFCLKCALEIGVLANKEI